MGEQRVVVVTGASTGIGRAVAVERAAAGWRVYAGVRNDAAAAELEATPGAVTALRLDVTDPAQIADAAARIEADLDGGAVHGLVNNAGIGLGGPLEHVPIDDLRRQLEVNVIGQIAVTQAMLPMLRRGPGRIVNVSSVSGRIAAPFLGPYAASKFALEALSDALRIELYDSGVRTVLIEPGCIETPIWNKTIDDVDAHLESMDAAERAQYGDAMAMVRASIDDSRRGAIPVDRVAHVIAKALTARWPKARYLVGPDARLVPILRLLPDRLRDALIRRELRRRLAAAERRS